jgi:CheY-like chemotaxis protein
MMPSAILLVEDNPADAYLTCRAITEVDKTIQIAVVPDGPTALAYLQKEAPYTLVSAPALVILDLNLPLLDGHEVLRAVRRLPAYATTPIVILSSAAKEREEGYCLQLGATAYLEKPFYLSPYRAAIHALMQRWVLPARTP